MMPTQLPNCPHCNAHSTDFSACGSSMGPGYLSQGFSCPCKAYFQYTSRKGGNVLVAFAPDQLVCDRSHDSRALPETYGSWMDDVVLPTWRFWALNPEDVSIVPPRVPDDLTVFVREGSFKSSTGSWKIIDGPLRLLSKSMVVPEDPLITDNRVYFNRVWLELTEALEGELEVKPTEIPNEYSQGNIPWFTFPLGSMMVIKVGCRKRVVAIKVECTDGLATADIEAVAKVDGVTFSVEGPEKNMDRVEFRTYLEGLEGVEKHRTMLDRMVWNWPEEGKLQRVEPEPGVAHALEIHAWTQAKAIEYLTILCRTRLLQICLLEVT